MQGTFGFINKQRFDLLSLMLGTIQARSLGAVYQIYN